MSQAPGGGAPGVVKEEDRMPRMPRVVPILLGAALTVSCGGSEPSTSAPATKKLRFAIIPKALDITVFNYAKIGAEREAAARGNIEVLWNAPASADQLKQKE